MATGDNSLTAVSVAKKCNIIQSSTYYVIDVNKYHKEELTCEKVQEDDLEQDEVILRDEDTDQDLENEVRSLISKSSDNKLSKLSKEDERRIRSDYSDLDEFMKDEGDAN